MIETEYEAEYVYYWPNLDVYVYPDELKDGIECWGNNYECWAAVDFFETIWNDEEP